MISSSSGVAGEGLYNTRHYDYYGNDNGVYGGGEEEGGCLVKMFILYCANNSKAKTEA